MLKPHSLKCLSRTWKRLFWADPKSKSWHPGFADPTHSTWDAKECYKLWYTFENVKKYFEPHLPLSTLSPKIHANSTTLSSRSCPCLYSQIKALSDPPKSSHHNLSKASSCHSSSYSSKASFCNGQTNPPDPDPPCPYKTLLSPKSSCGCYRPHESNWKITSPLSRRHPLTLTLKIKNPLSPHPFTTTTPSNSSSNNYRNYAKLYPLLIYPALTRITPSGLRRCLCRTFIVFSR